MSQLNTKLLTDLVNWAAFSEFGNTQPIPGFLGRWDQNHWAYQRRNGVCDTAYCMAGQAVVQSGKQIVYDDDNWYEDQVGGTLTRWQSATWCSPPVDTGKKTPKGVPIYTHNPDTETWVVISEAARLELGLTEDEADYLFNGDNELDRIIDLTAQITVDHGAERMKFLDPEVQEQYDHHRGIYMSYAGV